MQQITTNTRLFSAQLSEPRQIQIDGALFNRIQEDERSVVPIAIGI